MAETRVALPEPRPEDDEDVVWGLSTAKALWARGERTDALVWLRRAAEAANSAGQNFRASELGLYVSELEDVVAHGVPDPRAPMHASPDIEAPAPPAVSPDFDDSADTIADAAAAAEQLQMPRQMPKPPDDEEETLVRRYPQSARVPGDVGQVSSRPPVAHAAQALAQPELRRPGAGQSPAGARQYGSTEARGAEGEHDPMQELQALPPPVVNLRHTQPMQALTALQVQSPMHPESVRAVHPEMAPVIHPPSGPALSRSGPPTQPPRPASAPPHQQAARPTPPPPPQVSPAPQPHTSVPPLPLQAMPPPPPLQAMPPPPPQFVPNPPQQDVPPPSPQPAAPPPPHTAPPPPPPPLSRSVTPTATLVSPVRPGQQLPSPRVAVRTAAPTPAVVAARPIRSAPPTPTAVSPRPTPQSTQSVPPAPAIMESQPDHARVRAGASSTSPGDSAPPHPAPGVPARPGAPPAELAPDSDPPPALRPSQQQATAPSTATPIPAPRAPQPAPAASSLAPPVGEPRKRRRAPILDPWGEDLEPRSNYLTRRETSTREVRRSDPKLSEPRTSDAREVAVGPRAEAAEVELREDAVVVSVRSRPLVTEEEDDQVVTSAITLDALRRRTSARVPPPPPPPLPRGLRPQSDPKPEVGAVPPPPPVSPSAPPKAVSPPPPPLPVPVAASKPPEARADPLGLPASHDAVPRHAGQFSVPEEPSSRAKLAPDIEALPSKSPGGPQSAAGPQLPVEARTVAGLPLDRAEALGQLPHDTQASLATTARIERLGPDEEVSGFGVALVIDGDAFVSATVVDAPAARLRAGSLVPSRGNLGESGVALRVVAGSTGARVAVWDAPTLDAALRAHPWLAGDLRDRADRLQALAGITLGPLGELDETYRNLAVERLTVRLVRPGEPLASKGTPIAGLAIVGAGAVEVEEAGGTRALGPGELLFPDAVLRGLPAPVDARASDSGALLLIGERKLAHELLVTVPPLVEILGA